MKKTTKKTTTRLELYKRVCRPSVAELLEWYRHHGRHAEADELEADFYTWCSRFSDPDSDSDRD